MRVYQFRHFGIPGGELHYTVFRLFLQLPDKKEEAQPVWTIAADAAPVFMGAEEESKALTGAPGGLR